jgi:hypothetical protein
MRIQEYITSVVNKLQLSALGREKKYISCCYTRLSPLKPKTVSVRHSYTSDTNYSHNINDFQSKNITNSCLYHIFD